jgi:hypothetical protein
MKIEFIKHRHLNSLSRTVKPGEVIESSSSIPESLLLAYVNNGIAKDISKESGVKSEVKALTPNASPLTKGE